MEDPSTSFIACHDCDLLLREVGLEAGGTASCPRCGAALYRNSPDSLHRTLALAVAAALLFIIANIYPILGIEAQGNGNATNLYGAVVSLWHQKMRIIPVLVFITAMLVPALELALLIYLLLPLRLGKVPAGLTSIMRFLQYIKPWGMVEVFMLGILVALVKLADSFRIIPGIALWSFAGVTLLLAAVGATFNPSDVWGHLDWRRGDRA